MISDTIIPDAPVPEKLSDLIMLAVTDARSLDRNAYSPKSNRYHSASPLNGTCNVCLAGAVIAGTLQVPPDVEAIPAAFSRRWCHALTALDAVREGNMNSAMRQININSVVPDGFDRFRYVRPFLSDFQGWAEFDVHLDSLEVIAQQLREDGF